MEGHLQDEVVFLDKANDWFWQLGFIASILLSFRSGITFRFIFIFSTAVGFLLIASPLNLAAILIFPVLAACSLFAIGALIGWID